MVRSKKGQSIVEYIIVLTVVIGVFVLLAAPQGRFRRAVEEQYNRSAESVDRIVDYIPYSTGNITSTDTSEIP